MMSRDKIGESGFNRDQANSSQRPEIDNSGRTKALFDMTKARFRGIKERRGSLRVQNG